MKHDLSFHIRKESKGYSAQCIEFPSIITQADTKKELQENMTDAANGYFKAFQNVNCGGMANFWSDGMRNNSSFTQVLEYCEKRIKFVGLR